MKYLDREGNQVTVNKYIDLKRNPDYSVVASVQLGGDHEVTTLWVGIDDRKDKRRKLALFDTMLFRGDELVKTMIASDEEEAVKNHETLVKALQDEEEAFSKIAARKKIKDALKELSTARAELTSKYEVPYTLAEFVDKLNDFKETKTEELPSE